MWVLLWKLLANYIILKNGSTYLYLEAGFESSVTSLKNKYPPFSAAYAVHTVSYDNMCLLVKYSLSNLVNSL